MDQEYSTSLTLGDLKTIASLIEACTQRGVFRANELSVIGEIYNKIATSLLSIKDGDKGDSVS
jgi:hypothetical protein